MRPEGPKRGVSSRSEALFKGEGVMRGMQKRKTRTQAPAVLVVERVQTGVRMEKRILKVLKALAELHDITLGDLLEGIVLHAFEGKCPFRDENLKKIQELKRIYELDLNASASHRMTDAAPSPRQA